jgi:predicted transcriptional regulator
MTTQLAIRLDDADLAALDELAAVEGVSRSEAARQAIRYRAADTVALRNLKDQRRIDALLGVTPGTPWSTAQHVLAHSADATLAEDLADALGAESTDDMTDPWSK